MVITINVYRRKILFFSFPPGSYPETPTSPLEPQQNIVFVFSITLSFFLQKRVRPPVWIILALQAELASVRALLQRP